MELYHYGVKGMEWGKHKAIRYDRMGRPIPTGGYSVNDGLHKAITNDRTGAPKRSSGYGSKDGLHKRVGSSATNSGRSYSWAKRIGGTGGASISSRAAYSSNDSGQKLYRAVSNGTSVSNRVIARSGSVRAASIKRSSTNVRKGHALVRRIVGS